VPLFPQDGPVLLPGIFFDLSASNSMTPSIIRMMRRNTREKGSQHHNNDAKWRHRFKKAQYESSFEERSRQLRQRERITAASEQEPVLSRGHSLPTCQIEGTPAAHRPASVQVPSSSIQLSPGISWHANSRCVNHAPDQKLKSRSLLALDVHPTTYNYRGSRDLIRLASRGHLETSVEKKLHEAIGSCPRRGRAPSYLSSRRAPPRMIPVAASSGAQNLRVPTPTERFPTYVQLCHRHKVLAKCATSGFMTRTVVCDP